MTAAIAIKLALISSIMLIVFSVGTRSTLDDALWLARRPLLLLRSMLSIFVVVPAFAVWLCLTFDLAPPIKFAIIALAVSPLPPILSMKQESAGAEHAYAVSLLVTASVLALVATPLLVLAAGNVFGVDVGLSPLSVAKTLAITVGVPLAAGIAFRSFAPAAAEKTHDYASKAGKVVLVVGLLVIIAFSWRAFVALVGDGAVVAIAATVVVGLVAGHLLAGGDRGDRAALAIASATRHPGVAIAIATANFAEQAQVLSAAILLSLLVSAIVTVPYLKWVKRQPINSGAGASPA